MPVTVKIDPTVDMNMLPKTQVDTMTAAKYFTYAAELLKLHPPHITDEPIIAQMKRIGIEPGKSLDSTSSTPPSRRRGKRPQGCPAAHGVEGADARPSCERLVDEH